MFYEPGADPSDKSSHGLPHNPFKAIVAPRPIGWISSVDAQGVVNLAPYSFFNAIADAPPMVMFSNTGPASAPEGVKDSVRNIRATGAFVVNFVSEALRDAMNATSAGYPPEVDEFEAAGIEKAPSRLVAPPRVAASPAAFECKLWKTIDLPSAEGVSNALVIGEVVGVHIADEALTDGLFDVARLRLLARLGYMDYAVVAETFTLDRPKAG